MDSLWIAALLALAAGLMAPLGSCLATVERLLPKWLERDLRHGVIAFGGGILLAAVALVLVPEGVESVSLPWIVLSFLAGGVAFCLADWFLARRGTSASQFMALTLDFLPEAAAMGAAFSYGSNTGYLLALLIGLQNFPEGFNAYRELVSSGTRGRTTILSLTAISFLGPMAAVTGMFLLAERPFALGLLMLFSSGGILYLTFQDIAPDARLEKHWTPPLGAVLGFVSGLVGQMLIHG